MSFTSFSLRAQVPVIDGDMSDAAYVSLATYQFGNDGFGVDNDLGELKVHFDGTYLYLGISGEVTSNDRMVIMLDFSAYGGTTNLPNDGDALTDTYADNLDGTTLPNDVDFLFHANEGGGITEFFIDGIRYGTGSVLSQVFFGNSDQAGAGFTLPASDLNTLLGGITSSDGVSAYDNSFNTDLDKGWEMRIPLDAFDGVSASDDLSILVGIASSSGFWSNEFLPSVTGGGNPGNGANLLTFGAAFSTPFSLSTPFPVELLSFQAETTREGIHLHWKTSDEVNHSHFEIERSADGERWTSLDRVDMATKREADLNTYRYLDRSPRAGRSFYRLRQVDLDGTSSLSPQVQTFWQPQQALVLSPNPTAGEVTLHLPFAGEELLSLGIYDLTGRQVAQPAFQVEGEKAQLDLSTLPRGLYQLRARSAQGSYLARFQKQ